MLNLISVNNLEIKELKVYKTMRDNAFDDKNSFIADSPKVVNLLLKTDIQFKSILATQEYYSGFEQLIESKQIESLYVVEKELMQSIVGHKIHHNCMAHGIRPEQTPLDELSDSILMLDNITSTENVGSIARSMSGLGINSFLVPNTSPHPFGRRALRVSMGYVSHLKYHIYTDIFSTIYALKKRGYKVFAAELTPNSIPLQDVKVPTKWVLLMGHEGNGIAQEILDICDATVSIEMQENVKSFNVAIAASLIMYKFHVTT